MELPISGFVNKIAKHIAIATAFWGVVSRLITVWPPCFLTEFSKKKMGAADE